MQISVTDCTFRGRRSIRIDNGRLTAVFFTEFGGKFVSFCNTDTNYEFLWQGKEPVHPEPQYGGLYVENDLCGADDIFPSINPAYYPAWPWEGVKCPPHGELWSIPWNHRYDDESVTFTAHGVRLPYSIERRASFTGENVLRFDYRLINHSPFPMPGIWALHPLFYAGSDTRIELPEGTSEIINTLNFHNRLGKTGNTHPWPVTSDKNGVEYRLDGFAPDSGVCEKFFCRGKVAEGKVALRREAPGASLTLRFPTDTVPYLGVWKNQGGLMEQNNIALEPATGALDDIWASQMWEECGEIPAKGEIEFWLEFAVE